MATRTQVTLQAFLADPGIDERRLELIDGEVVEKPMPTWGHSRLAYLVCRQLEPFGYPGVEPRAIIEAAPGRPEASPIPDAAFYRTNPPARSDWMRQPPAVAIEVLSPGQSLAQMRRKVAIYESFGVESTWIIDGERQAVHVYEQAAERIFRPGEMLTSIAVPGLEFDVAVLFVD
jgi:Uma2 family endonuclease